MLKKNNISEHKMSLFSAGAVTSTGMSLPATYAAIRAGLDNFQETDFFNLYEPIIGAPIQYTSHPSLPSPFIRGQERLAFFFKMAVEECLHMASLPIPCPHPIPILLVLGEAVRNSRTQDLITICKDTYSTLLLGTEKIPFYITEVGGVGIIDALNTANVLLKEYPLVIIAAVDSWLNVPDIQFSLRQERLLSQSNSTGFIPSEGASAILVGNPVLLKANDITINNHRNLTIESFAKSQESSTIAKDDPCYGKGLAQAINNALKNANFELSDIQSEFTNLLSEPYFFEEAAYARARLLRKPMPHNFERIHPANSLGNIGSPFGPLLLGMAWEKNKKSTTSYAPTLITLSSSGEERGAIILAFS